MEPNLYLDVQMFSDGTARWLWQLRGENSLFSAGVAMSRTDAQKAGEEALLALGARQHAAQAVMRGPDWQTDTLNLDELERMDRLDREQRKGEG